MTIIVGFTAAVAVMCGLMRISDALFEIAKAIRERK